MLMTSGYGNDSHTIQLWNKDYYPIWTDTLPSPSYIISYHDFLFVASESEENATIYSYRYDKNQYILLDKKSCDATNLCHLCYSPKNHLLFGCCWGSGHLLVSHVSENGLLSPIQSYEQKSTDSIKKSRVHCAVLNQKENLLITTNIGLDCLIIYSIKSNKILEERRVSLPDQSGPRHMVLSKDKNLLYVCTENSNEVFVLDMADYKILQKISTTNAINSNCSAICLSEDLKHLYVANRFSDTIAHFPLQQDGMLKKPTLIPCTGKNPRHMFLNSDHQLVIAYQDSSMVSVLSFNDEGHPNMKSEKQIPQQNAAGLCEIIL